MSKIFLPKNDEVSEIVAVVKADPGAILEDEALADQFFAAVQSEVVDHGFDPETSKGRDGIKSLAHEIRRLKVAIDDAGKQKTEEWRQRTAAVNGRRNHEKARYESLVETVRKPVTEAEEKEKARIAEADSILAMLRDVSVPLGATPDDVLAMCEKVRGINLNPDILGPRIDMAQDLKQQAVDKLTAIHADMVQREAEKQELERLRQQEANRKAAEEAQRVVEQRRAQEAADKKKAAEEARIAAEREAQRLIDEAAAEAERRVKEAEAAAAEEIRKAEDEARRLKDAEDARIADELAKNEAAQARREDAEHRKRVMSDIIDAILTQTGVGRMHAEQLVGAIIKGTIPNVHIAF